MNNTTLYPTTAGGWMMMIAFAGMLLAVLAILIVLRLGPARWPQPARELWAMMPPDAQKMVSLIASTPITWLLLGMVIGSSFINPLARTLRALLP